MYIMLHAEMRRQPGAGEEDQGLGLALGQDKKRLYTYTTLNTHTHTHTHTHTAHTLHYDGSGRHPAAGTITYIYMNIKCKYIYMYD